MKKIFDFRNITAPVKFLLRVLFGISSKKERDTRKILTQAWGTQQSSNYSRAKTPVKMLLKSLLLALVGSALALVITLFRQHKHGQLQ